MFLDNHGNYEIICKAKKNVFNKEQEIRFVVEANDSNDAKNIAEKQLKTDGKKIYEIESIKHIKSTRRVRNVVRTIDTGMQNQTPQKNKILIEIGIVAFMILVVIFVLVGTGVIG